MAIYKRIAYIILIATLFIVAAYNVIKIVDHKGEYITYRDGIDSTGYAEYLARNNDKAPTTNITLGEYIIAGFAAISAMLGAFKYFEEKRGAKLESKVDEISIKVDDLANLIYDKKNKEVVLAKIDEITRDWIHNVDYSETKILISSIGERAKKFALETMVQNLTSDDLECANVNIDNRCRETSKQVNELNFTEKFKDAFHSVQAANVIALRKELIQILDDKMRNHKYERYGTAVTDFVRHFMRDIGKIDTKYNEL